MIDIITQLTKIKSKVKQKEYEIKKINELKELIKNQHLNHEDTEFLKNTIQILENKYTENSVQGLEKLKKYRLNTEITSKISNVPNFIYPDLIESAKFGMIFSESGVGKTLMMTAFANFALENNTIKSVVFLDFDNGLISLKKRRYDQLADKWGEDKFNYLLGNIIIQDMDPIVALKELILDDEKNKDTMIIIDSGSHFVYDGTRNERQRLKELIDVIRILKTQGASLIIIHHSHRVRDGKDADYHGSFEWKRDLDYQIQVTKNEENCVWLFKITKNRDYLLKSKAFKYDEKNILPIEVSYDEYNFTKEQLIFIKMIQNILMDFKDKVNQSELLKEIKYTRQSIGLGEKRTIKWLHDFGEKKMWSYEKVTNQNNSIFYWLDDNLKNSSNLPKY
ncbi:helicase RepA family protein [Aliarcobacter butzleri]|uniref:helicase RepA family protein n=1 Tax=Aliarcobacter TaxID=2321111 RepID=UPI0021B4B2C5|nr:helicase RepA family protein [Aliarcobacter butzleri]MCT7597273.1 helicase RepA family protein [Aliarcobacter butzleri]